MTPLAPVPEEGPPRLGGLAACILALLSILPYLNGLGGDFTYDDKPIVRDNARIESPAKAGEVFTTHYFGGSLVTGTNYRPVVLLTYAVERWIHGNRPVPFHVVNVALHAAVTVLLAVWLLALRFPRGGVLAASALFAVIPIHVEAVTSIVGRAETLAALLVVASALLWLRATEGERLGRGSYVGALVAFLLSVFVKESAAVLPGVVGLGEMFRDGRGDGFLRKGRDLVRKRGLAFAGLFIPLAALFLVRHVVLEGFLVSSQAAIFDLENPLVRMRPLLRMANALLLLFRYALKTFWPTGLSADDSAYALDLAGKLADPRAVLPLLGMALVLVAAAALARSRPLFSFGVLFYLGTFLPASNLLFPIGTIYAERLAYLPSMGLLLAAAALFVPPKLAVPRPQEIRWREGLVLAAVLGYGTATVVRNRVWASDATLFADTVRKVPRSAKARYNWAYELNREKKVEEARRNLEEAVAIFPRHYEAWAFLGKIAWDQKRLDDAIRLYRRSTEIFPAYENGQWGLAKTLQDAGKLREADAAFREGIHQLPEAYALAYHRAIFFEKIGEPAKAEREWRRALIVGDWPPEARLGHAKVLLRLGRKSDAERETRLAIRSKPSYAEARKFLSEIGSLKQPVKAAPVLELAPRQSLLTRLRPAPLAA